MALRPGDGVIHSWLNRLLLPDTVGTGGDSHTRFPIGISFPAGSGLVAFGAATGVMPLDMPESVLVRFKGELQPGVTLRDLVHAIPLYAIKQGLLTVAKAGKKNIFSGKILEIEGLPDLKVEQAFELSDASAERSAAGCTIKLNPEPIKEYLTSNVVLIRLIHGLAEPLARARPADAGLTALPHCKNCASAFSHIQPGKPRTCTLPVHHAPHRGLGDEAVPPSGGRRRPENRPAQACVAANAVADLG